MTWGNSGSRYYKAMSKQHMNWVEQLASRFDKHSPPRWQVCVCVYMCVFAFAGCRINTRLHVGRLDIDNIERRITDAYTISLVSSPSPLSASPPPRARAHNTRQRKQPVSNPSPLSDLPLHARTHAHTHTRRTCTHARPHTRKHARTHVHTQKASATCRHSTPTSVHTYQTYADRQAQ